MARGKKHTTFISTEPNDKVNYSHQCFVLCSMLIVDTMNEANGWVENVRQNWIFLCELMRFVDMNSVKWNIGYGDENDRN